MSAIEIVGGVILLVVSAVIIALTLMQHTHGQGLSTALQPRMTTGLFFCLEGRAPARWRRPLWKC